MNKQIKDHHYVNINLKRKITQDITATFNISPVTIIRKIANLLRFLSGVIRVSVCVCA